MPLPGNTVSNASSHERKNENDMFIVSFRKETSEAFEKNENKINHLAQTNRDVEVVRNSLAQIEKDQRKMSFVIFHSEESIENDGVKLMQHDNKIFEDLSFHALGIGKVKQKIFDASVTPRKTRKGLRITK